MAESDVEPTFADPFPPAQEAQWHDLVSKVLKGAPFERLVSKTYDGIAIAPLYGRPHDDPPRAPRGTQGPWRIAMRVDAGDPEPAATFARDDLDNGATSLHVVFAGAVGAYGFGIAPQPGMFENLGLAEWLAGGAHLEIDAGPRGYEIARSLASLVKSGDLDPASVRINFGIDPLGVAALSGGSQRGWPDEAAQLAQAARFLLEQNFMGRVCLADGRVVHAAGGSPAQELAFVVASGLSCLRALEDGGIDLEIARRLIGFRLAADADQFATIAKFRALRQLWARVEEACGLNPQPIHIHAETAWRMMTRRDPWVNVLRGTIACFSAGLGGADVVTVLPFSQALGLPDAFGRRIARNTQTVLIEEAGLGRVADPAGGAGGFEALTKAICERAYTLVQASERAGGLPAWLVSGELQAMISDVRQARARNIAQRRDSITGVSEFPNIHEAPVDVLARFVEDAPTGEKMSIAFTALKRHRDAEGFEALRDAADARAHVAGVRQKIFLANLGPISAFTARAMFAANFFEAGGIEAIGNEGFLDDAALIAAFRKSGTISACICSSDEINAARAEATAKALVAAGAKAVWYAGRASDREDALRQAGVTGFIHVGCDVIATLEAAQKA